MDQELPIVALNARAHIDWQAYFKRKHKGPWLTVEAFTPPMLEFWGRYYDPDKDQKKYSVEYDTLLRAISVKRGFTFEAIEEGFLRVRKGDIYKKDGKNANLNEYAIVVANVAGLTAPGAAYPGYDIEIQLLDDSLKFPPRNRASKPPNSMPSGVS